MGEGGGRGYTTPVPLPAPPPPPDPPALVSPAPRVPAPVTLRVIGRWDSGRPGVSAAEVPAWSADGRGLCVTDAERGLRLLDTSDPAAPVEAGLFEAEGVNSVAVAGERVAVAAAGPDPLGPGRLILLGPTLEPVAELPTGVGPDVVLALPGGGWVTADEGQPAGGLDPVGGVTAADAAGDEARTVVFDAVPPGVRAGAEAPGPATLEPEYLAASADGRTVYASLQENNAIGVFGVEAGAFTDVLDLGLLDRSADAAGFDASDRDGGVRLHRWPVSAMPQPDAIALREVGGRAFLLTANEGELRDAEEEGGFTDAAAVASLGLDLATFPEATWLRADANLGRLRVARPGTHPAVDPDGDGDVDRLIAFGGRSLSVYEVVGEAGDRRLELRWDSGDTLERLVAAEAPDAFNAGTGKPDSRSDQKGPEPEGLVLGEVGGRVCAFLGLERSHGIVVFDVTDPQRPTLAGSIFSAPADLAPEGLAFLPAERSPSGVPLLAVAFEETGTVVIYAVEADR